MATDTTEPTLTIEIEISGEKFTNVTEYMIKDSFVVDSDAWSATIFSQGDPAELRRKFQPLTRIRLYIGDKLQLIGRIDGSEGAGGGSAALNIWGRDYFADLVDPNIDPTVVIGGKMTLADALLEGFRVFGITEIQTDLDEVRNARLGKTTYETTTTAGASSGQGSAPSLSNTFPGQVTVLRDINTTTAHTEPVENAKPNEGEGALEWGQRLCARSGFIIQPGTKRNAIAVVRPDYSKKPVFAFSRPGNLQNGTAKRDWSGVPSVASLRSRSVTSSSEAEGKYKLISPVGDNSEISLWQIEECKRILTRARADANRIPVKQKGDTNNYYIPVYYRDDDAKSEAQLNRSARRMFADRIRDTLTYSAELKGHTDIGGGVYCTNVLASVKDATEDVDEILWIMDRTISFKPGVGEMTQLTLIRPASYVL